MLHHNWLRSKERSKCNFWRQFTSGDSPSYHKSVMFYQHGAGPDPSTFPVVCSTPELWLTLRATVQPRAARAATLSTLEQKWSTFEAKTPCLAMEGVES